MKIVRFFYSGRLGHFLRAEATANALTYPVPPRTVLLGLCGAILGLPKDAAQVLLQSAQFAVCGPIPEKFWHKANMRKTLPIALPYNVKKSDKGSTAEEKNTRLPQEMLWQPRFEIFASMPESHQADFDSRVRQGRTHFTPCLGLSELIASVEWISTDVGTLLPEGEHDVECAIPMDRGNLDGKYARDQQLAIQKIRMPRSVDPKRVFVHENYLLERDARAIRIQSANVYQVGRSRIVFL